MGATNEDAIKNRGTSIPGTVNCPFWEPCPTIDELKEAHRKLPWYKRIFNPIDYNMLVEIYNKEES